MIPDPFLRVQESADALEEGYFLLQRRRARRVDLPVRIWFGPPIDEDGEELDRSPRWQVMIAGALLGVDPWRLAGLLITSLADVWPACRNDPIEEPDYRYRMQRQEWSGQYDPEDPFGSPGSKIDPMTARLPFQ